MVAFSCNCVFPCESLPSYADDSLNGDDLLIPIDELALLFSRLSVSQDSQTTPLCIAMSLPIPTSTFSVPWLATADPFKLSLSNSESFCDDSDDSRDDSDDSTDNNDSSSDEFSYDSDNSWLESSDESSDEMPKVSGRFNVGTNTEPKPFIAISLLESSEESSDELPTVSGRFNVATNTDPKPFIAISLPIPTSTFSVPWVATADPFTCSLSLSESSSDDSDGSSDDSDDSSDNNDSSSDDSDESSYNSDESNDNSWLESSDESSDELS